MRVVLDTNVTISGLLWSGAPRQVLDAARAGNIDLFSSAELLDEVDDVLQRKKLASRLKQVGKTSRELINAYTALVTLVTTVPLSAPISADPDDDTVLACALAAQAEAIVSGDDDLLALRVFQNIPILTAPELLVRLAISAQS